MNATFYFSRFLRNKFPTLALAIGVMTLYSEQRLIAQEMPARVIIREVAKITADDARAGDWMSGSPTFTDDGQFLIVGAFGHDLGPARTGNFNDTTGAVYIFQRDPNDPGAWTQFQKLQPDDLSNLGGSGDLQGSGFGAAIENSGDILVVGSEPGLNYTADTGAIYVFRRNTETGFWEQIQKLTSPANDPNDNYTRANLDGDILVARASDAENARGIAYIYNRNEGGPDNWGLIKTLRAPDANPGDRFGLWGRLDGDLLAIGASGDDEAAMDAGAVYLFRRDEGGPNNWGLVKKLMAPDAAAGDEFYSVALSGDTILIGARLRDEQALNSGAAYVFERNQGGTNQWGFVTKIVPSDGLAGDNFAWNIDLEGDVAVAAAWGNFDAQGTDKDGAVYVFHRNQGGPDQWGEVTKVVPSDQGEDQYSIAFGCCGFSPRVQDGMLAVGEIGDDERAENAGAVYLFQVIEPYKLDIARAVQLSWPDVNSNAVVEGATSADGPWEIIEGAAIEEDGLFKMTIPADGQASFFRLVQE